MGEIDGADTALWLLRWLRLEYGLGLGIRDGCSTKGLGDWAREGMGIRLGVCALMTGDGSGDRVEAKLAGSRLEMGTALARLGRLGGWRLKLGALRRLTGLLIRRTSDGVPVVDRCTGRRDDARDAREGCRLMLAGSSIMTQFFRSSSVGVPLEICLRFAAGGGVDSGVSRS